jgi:hypothetical protein
MVIIDLPPGLEKRRLIVAITTPPQLSTTNSAR